MMLGNLRTREAVPAYIALLLLLVSPLQAGPPSGQASRSSESVSDTPSVLLVKFNRSKRSGNTAAKRSPASPKGSSSSAARKAAIADLPLDQMQPAHRKRVMNVIDSAGMFRRLPTLVFATDPNVYEFFIHHPDVAVSIWRAMEISKLQMWQTGRYEYEGDAQDGTIGTLDVLHQSAHKSVIVCQGEFKNVLLPRPVHATSVITLYTSYFKEADGTTYVTHRADLFVSFPSQTVESVAKVLSPLSGRMADRTFSEVSLFLKMMSMAMGKRPGWVEQLTQKLDSIPNLRREQLLKLIAQAYAAAQKRERNAARHSDPSHGRHVARALRGDDLSRSQLPSPAKRRFPSRTAKAAIHRHVEQVPHSFGVAAKR